MVAETGTSIARVTCTHDCPDACAMLVTVRDGRAVAVAPNPAHPVTGRHLCVKVDRYLERVYSPDRLLHPLRRTGAEGAAAILPYSYLGSMGTLATFGTTHALFHRLGASRLERTICGGQNAGLTGLVGPMRTDPEHLVDARLILVWGMDPISTSVPTRSLIRRARERGARLVVIDPHRSRPPTQ